MNKHEIKRNQSRSAIFQAARELISERGFNGITLQEILQKANVTKGKFFHYFDSKDDLYSALLVETLKARGMPDYRAFVESCLCDSPVEKLLCLVDEMIKWHAEGVPEVMRLCVFATFFFSPETKEIEAIRVRLHENRKVFVDLFEEAQSKGQLPKHLDPNVLGTFLASLGVGGNNIGYLSKVENLGSISLSEFRKLLEVASSKNSMHHPSPVASAL